MKGAATEVLNKTAFYYSHGRNEAMTAEKSKEFQSHAELLGSEGLRGCRNVCSECFIHSLFNFFFPLKLLHLQEDQVFKIYATWALLV